MLTQMSWSEFLSKVSDPAKGYQLMLVAGPVRTAGVIKEVALVTKDTSHELHIHFAWLAQTTRTPQSGKSDRYKKMKENNMKLFPSNTEANYIIEDDAFWFRTINPNELVKCIPAGHRDYVLEDELG